MNRRTALANLSSLGMGAALGEAQAAQGGVGRTRGKLRKIATEEAFTVPEVVNALRDVVRAGGSNLDLPSPPVVGNPRVELGVGHEGGDLA